MGIYLSFANKCLQYLKPQVEKKFRTKLEDMVVKDSYDCPLFNQDPDYFSDNLMFVARDYPDTIFITEKNHDKKYILLSSIPRELNHELAHKVHHELITEEFLVRDKTKSLKRYNKNKPFREGFAEFASLDYLTDIYDINELEQAKIREGVIGRYGKFSPKNEPYAQGYKFFRKVLSTIGKDKLLEVAKSPPISKVEVKFPILYLLRKYPSKGIKNIPKFLKHGLKTKVLRDQYSLFSDYLVIVFGLIFYGICYSYVSPMNF